MLENYRRKEVVKAEQYDGSQDVVDRYGIHSRVVNGKVMDILLNWAEKARYFSDEMNLMLLWMYVIRKT